MSKVHKTKNSEHIPSLRIPKEIQYNTIHYEIKVLLKLNEVLLLSIYTIRLSLNAGGMVRNISTPPPLKKNMLV